MKTALPTHIDTRRQMDARKLLKELHSNREHYHPDDDAREFFGEDEGTKLNALMKQILSIRNFDAYQFLIDLDNPRTFVFFNQDMRILAENIHILRISFAPEIKNLKAAAERSKDYTRLDEFETFLQASEVGDEFNFKKYTIKCVTNDNTPG